MSAPRWRNARGPIEAEREAIEQAVARGQLPTDIAADRGLPLLDVLHVAQRMDRLAYVTDPGWPDRREAA